MKSIVYSVLVIFLLSACSSGKPASIQGQWKLISYSIDSPAPPPNQLPAVTDVETSIELDSEGRMTGNVGCNDFSADYTVDGDTVTFGPVIATLMFCGGSSEQEMRTFAVLQKSATLVINGNMLTITSADGNSSIVLERK